jgi:hypothetical protein
MPDVTTVPTIAQTIRQTLTERGYSQYATLPVVDTLAQALMDRERSLYGDGYQSGQPVTDEILRRLEENQNAEHPGPVSPVDDDPSYPLSERVARLETDLASLTAFARDNGYRL